MIPNIPRTVLVVDDEEDARELVKFVLQPLGYSVFGAASGEEGLVMLREEAVAVALVDLLMPGMNGRQFIEHLGSLPESIRPVCIVNSARRRPEVEKEMQGLDFFHIITKPFELGDLERRITQAWEEKKRRASL